MSKHALSYTAIGLSAFAQPALAQEFYLGAVASGGTFEGTGVGYHIDPVIVSEDVTSVDFVGGVRFDVGGDFFLGAEFQTGNPKGFPTSDPYLPDDIRFTQAELHIGFNAGRISYFGFLGTAKNNFTDAIEIETSSYPSVVGLGAEIGLSDSAALRLEAEISTMTFDDACSGVYEGAQTRDVSAGIIFSF